MPLEVEALEADASDALPLLPLGDAALADPEAAAPEPDTSG
jgi:hypothetical protein